MRFDFYEVVRVGEGCRKFPELAGAEGVVLGRAEDDRGRATYAVAIGDERTTWSIEESDLESTGRFASREEFYDGTSVRVSVDPETGEGRIDTGP